MLRSTNISRRAALTTAIAISGWAIGPAQAIIPPSGVQIGGDSNVNIVVNANGQTIVQGTSYQSDTSLPLYYLPAWHGTVMHEAAENPRIPSHHVNQTDPVVQHFFSTAPNGAPVPTAPMPSTILSFDGMGVAGCGCAPPDTDGEVGKTQYVQMTNSGYQVFDKTTGVSVLGPAATSSIWAGFGGVCETDGHGDPVVLYDQIAERWIITQFAGAAGGAITDECIAVSTTSDATASYHRYGYHLGSEFYDYPHLGVWTDGYYMAMNVFNAAGTAFLRPQPFAFDRAAMIAGNTSAAYVTTTSLTSTDSALLPADLDGSTLPPVNAPETFVEYPDNSTYRVYRFHPDYVTPANTTFTLAASPAAAAFTQPCGSTSACVPTKAGSANYLNALDDRLMFRLAYRNFGDHESLVGNYSVMANSVSGVRWFELRSVTSGTPVVYQESTYQPDSTWRWMGSVAMDKQGNLAVGYSASNSTINPQIRYAGRLAGDPLNTLTQTEAHLFDGAGSQSGSGNRWGDYSDLTVDPIDDCTFWYTQEYYATNGSFGWSTRIGSFKFPGCGSTGGTPTANFTFTTSGLTATFTDSSTDAGGTISSYSWTFGDGGTSTTASPSHTYAAAGTYSVTETVTDGVSAKTSSKTASVTVASAGGTPTANFGVVTNGLTATFTDSSTDSGGTISSHAWTFGDGGTSTVTNPVHTYAAAGTYSVTETVTDGVSGKTSSKTVSVSVTSGGGALTATYNSTLKAPGCSAVGSSCDSGPSLLLGRGTMSGGVEANQPNTINNSCADGTSGTFHSDESNDRLMIATTDGTPLAAGKTVTVTSTVWAYNGTDDALDLYYAANANSPSWVLINTIKPTASGVQTLSATFTLPSGSLQAVRANFRYQGSASSCSTGSYDDHDDLVFAVGAGTGGTPTANFTFTTSGLTATFTDTSTDSGGSISAHSWTFGDGGTSTATSPSHTYAAAGTYSVVETVTDGVSGKTSSKTASVSVASGGGALTATYNSTLKAPGCSTVGSSCDSGPSLLLGRGTISGGVEANQPNTINNSCADGTSGTFHSDESNDRLKIATTDGSPLAAGKTVTVTSTVWAYDSTSDALDLYYAANANSPSWVFIKTISPTVSGVQTLSATFTLPTGSLQAVRANFRYLGSASSCSTGSYDDHDDLVFAVQ
ncbi:PKD domain-containing protein [Dokdonella soli]|uniref:PKD domain-containing protein n=1 Tax=Dokdonella soli TaxID=529810 RepID=A0ABN1IWV4_9GAMM